MQSVTTRALSQAKARTLSKAQIYKNFKVRVLVDKHDNRYIFRVGKDIEEHPRDILEKGAILAYRLGKDKTRNPHGEAMGLLGKGYNGSTKIKIGDDIPEEELNKILQDKLLEAKGLSPAPLKTPLIHRYQGNEIFTDDKGKHFIKSNKHCAACPNIIEGKQYLTFNNEGLKVVKMEPFEADDPNVTRASIRGKKLLCPVCIVKSIKREEIEEIDPFVVVESYPRKVETIEESVEKAEKVEEYTSIQIPYEVGNTAIVEAIKEGLKLKKRVAKIEAHLRILCQPGGTEVPGDYIKGLVYGYMIMLNDDEK